MTAGPARHDPLARWRPTARDLLGFALLGLALLVYPWAIDSALARFGVRPVAALLLALALAGGALPLGAPGGLRIDLPRVPGFPGAIALLLAGALGTGDVRWLFLVPAFVYLWLALLAAASLREPISLIERVARFLQPRAPDFIRSYCRKVTALWCLFFAATAATIAGLARRRRRAPRLLLLGPVAAGGPALARRVRGAQGVVPLLRRRAPRPPLVGAAARGEQRARPPLPRLHPRGAGADARGGLHAAGRGALAMSARARVVVTGMAGLCALGATGRACARRCARALGRHDDSRVGVDRGPAHAPRRAGGAARPERTSDARKLRGMGRVALLARAGAELALADAGAARERARLGDGTLGLAFGSTSGSPPALVAYARAFGVERSTRAWAPIDYLKLMSHTVAANLAQFFESPRTRHPDLQRVHLGQPGDRLRLRGDPARHAGRDARRRRRGAPRDRGVGLRHAARDLDAQRRAPAARRAPSTPTRDGLVVGEGAGRSCSRSSSFARARGARIQAEVVGFGTNCDGLHLTNPDADGMRA